MVIQNKIGNIEKNRLMMMISLSFIICHLSFLPAGAQTFTTRLQQSARGQGVVTVHHDKAIDLLVNGNTTESANPASVAVATPPAVVAAPVAAKPVAAKPVAATAPAKPAAAEQAARQSTKATAVHPQDAAPAPSDTASTGKKTGPLVKITGYRVQVFAGGNSRQDKHKAEQTGSQLRALFPTEAVYTHFYPPRWICRMGNYRTYEEASKMLQEVKKQGFTAATIVKGKVTVQNE